VVVVVVVVVAAFLVFWPHGPFEGVDTVAH